MQTTSLRKGENTALLAAPVVLSVAVQGPAVDVSALLLGPDGKVRGDNDLVFYNHPTQDGVTISGSAVTADLVRVPAGVDRVVVVASVDPLQPGAVFARAPKLTVSQNSASPLSFTAPDFASGETVVVLAELYRRGEGWKVRAVDRDTPPAWPAWPPTTASRSTPNRLPCPQHRYRHRRVMVLGGRWWI